jgi:hypothetical protein
MYGRINPHQKHLLTSFTIFMPYFYFPCHSTIVPGRKPLAPRAPPLLLLLRVFPLLETKGVDLNVVGASKEDSSKKDS